MKTLDEVITALENLTTCDDTGYSYIADDDAADALHYLKEYRAQKVDIWETKDELTALREYWAKQQANPPLSWDELKQMEGKPVWVEIIGQKLPLDSSWGIATAGSYKTWQGVESWTLVRPGAQYSLAVADYGKTWQAYRKERG